MHSDHYSPIHLKWAQKIIQVVGDFVGDLVDSRKTRSQFHNAFSTCELNFSERSFMMDLYDPHKYIEYSLDPIWKKKHPI